MKTRMNARARRVLFASLATTIALLASSPAHASSAWYDDPRFQQWARDYLAGRASVVRASVERDLKSPSPHPLATFVWLKLAGTDPATLAAADPAVAAAVRPCAEIMQDRDADRMKQAQGRLPPARASSADACTLLQAMWSAERMQIVSDEIAYLNAITQKWPDAFVAAWQVTYIANGALTGDEKVRGEVLARATNGVTSAGPAGAFVRALVPWHTPSTALELASVDTFLKDRPRDSWALHYRATRLATNARYEDAAKATEAAWRIDPFIRSATEAAEYLLRAEKDDAARTLLKSAARLRGGTQEEIEAREAESVVESLRAAGERGKARDEAVRALGRFPTSVALLASMADIELGSDRAGESVQYARKILEHPRAPHLEAVRRLMEALRRSGKPFEAYDAYLRATQGRPDRFPSLYWEAATALDKLDRKSERLALLDEARKAHPDALWLAREYADALASMGRKAEALAALRAVLERDPTVGVGNIAAFSASPEAADALLAELRTRAPWAKPVWEQSSSRIEGADAVTRKLALWAEARQKNPSRQWPYEQTMLVLHEAERWPAAEATVRDAMKAKLIVGDDADALLDFAWTLRRRSKVMQFDAATADEALRALDTFLARGGKASLYYEYRAELLMALGRKEAAIEAALAWARTSRDSSDPLWFVANNGRADGKEWLAANQYLQRDPYDSARLVTLQKLHVLYGGSPIVGLWLGSLLEQRQPTKAGERADGKAWEQLGDAARTYELTYQTRSSLSPSDRYIGWFDATRANAQRAASRVGLPFDAKSQTACPVEFARKFVTPGSQTWAVVCHANGEIVVREDHPVSGKIKLLQHGAAFVRYTYDATGVELHRIDASSGEWVALDYDGQGRIKTMRDSQGKPITFEYNAQGKPTRIAVLGKGELVVTYRANGTDIAKTESPQGYEVASEVSGAFQRLLELIRPASGSMAQVPRLAHADARLDGLRTKVKASHDAAQGAASAVLLEGELTARLALASYLVDHVQDDARHPVEAERELTRVLTSARAKDATATVSAFGVDAASGWYRLKLATRPAGLSATELDFWSNARAWVEGRLGSRDGKKAGDVLKLAMDRPLGFLETARWLPGSDLRTPGPWRRHPMSKLLPEPLRMSTRLNVAHVRKNGHAVIGTSRGLLILRRGFWEWYGFDEARGVFSATMPYDKATGTSDVLALAEDPSGTLYVGTAAGLFAIKQDYDVIDKSWRSSSDGLASPRIEHLGWTRDGLLVGTSAGARLVDAQGTLRKPEQVGDEAIVQIAPPRSNEAHAPALIVTARGLFGLALGHVTELAAGPVESAVWYAEESRAVFLRNRSLYGVRWVSGAVPSPATVLSGPKDVIAQQRVSGVSLLPIDRRGAVAVAVLTDLGLSLYRDAHLEHLDLKDVARVDRVPGVMALDGRGPRAIALTTDGAYVLELDHIQVFDGSGKVRDLLTQDDLGMTLVARDEGLYAIRHDASPPKEELVDAISPTVLARHPDGGWVTNDGQTIMRYNPTIGAPQRLFEAMPKREADDGRLFAAGPVRSIVVAADRAVWVVSGSYVYRFKDGAKQVFSTALDPTKFPARSEMLSRVVETIDGKIWVIASNEGHLQHKGTVLGGGVVEWTGDGFRRIEAPGLGDGWFIRSYTTIDKTQAFAGTSQGFARHRNGRYELLTTANDPSYKRLRDAHPGLHLGTHGARLGSIWLFGSVEGVVAWKDGTWFFPDRINWMLPAQGLALYGSRNVHAVETDRHGRVYVGTDHGLLVYDSGGGDPASFLLTNDLEALAFADADAHQFQAESDVLIGGLTKGSALSERLARVNAMRKELDLAKARLEEGLALPRLEGPTSPNAAPSVPKGDKLDEAGKKKLETELREKERVLNTMLLQFEREQPGVFQMLELKPLDLSSLRANLGDDQVIVQYLPTGQKLYVQVVTKAGREVREVSVSGRELLDRALRASNRIGGRPPGKLRGLVLDAMVREKQPPLEDELAWLYQQLLRPVEGDIAGKKYVYVVPVGELTYLPFGALIRQKSPTVEYAVERFTFGYVTSLYMFELMLKNKPAGGGTALVFGDPDGSLPGAREEARRVAGMVKGSALRVGKDATYDALVNGSTNSRVLHFATHGLLDHQRPERSALLLANNVLLTVPDAMTLKLGTTDLVVLSACNTGIGRSGMEYASLARAFMNAGTSSVLATLWSVDDDASKKLMEVFYTKMGEGETRMAALAFAQRALLKDPKLANPAMWASYITFGHP